MEVYEKQLTDTKKINSTVSTAFGAVYVFGVASRYAEHMLN